MVATICNLLEQPVCDVHIITPIQLKTELRKRFWKISLCLCVVICVSLRVDALYSVEDLHAGLSTNKLELVI